ncbi:phytoene/squalene synthase family protein [Fructobacillus papyrifericola]|uniref:Phytoene/squalene synthase family protein n=1 Tax=Fructobacillus papyrifericola TaxID=2713172 RepID=A0ABS5QXY8_9LACO|nr:phytoene/squalene synthase family protein [Fructobacillus papyrifericola]MBS9336747.1 phytoene/squalene synthase family protein [Fructobacillus papyrifericola]
MSNSQTIPSNVLKSFYNSKKTIKKNSSSFYFAFSKLDKEKSYSIFVIYDYLRKLDDAADNNKQEIFNKLVASWEIASKKKRVIINEESNIADKVAYVFNFFSIEKKLMRDMINGQLHDINHSEIETLTELEDYCYQVAGTVGCIIFNILSPCKSYNRKAVINVGIALQLTNILRDVYEDANADRFFIPSELLLKYRIQKNELLNNHTNKKTRALLKYLAQVALSKYQDADLIVNQISDKKNKNALSLSIIIYKEILLKMINNNFIDISTRVHVNNTKKLVLWIQNKQGTFLSKF